MRNSLYLDSFKFFSHRNFNRPASQVYLQNPTIRLENKLSIFFVQFMGEHYEQKHVHSVTHKLMFHVRQIIHINS